MCKRASAWNNKKCVKSNRVESKIIMYSNARAYNRRSISTTDNQNIVKGN